MLFQVDLTGASPAEVFPEFWTGQQTSDEARAFAESLVLGVSGKRRELDAVVAGSADHWRVERMAVVDRNVLRMAAFELLYEPETPPVVVIDEAIEIAKKFGSKDSGSFINGILDDLRRRVERGELRPPEEGGH
jgi:N utilization substance protein B